MATTTGYVDVGAGLVLTGKQFLPLARQLFSSRHHDQTSQNRVEEAVLAAALAPLARLALLGRRLTIGKLAEAIGLDFHRHRRAWRTAWLT